MNSIALAYFWYANNKDTEESKPELMATRLGSNTQMSGLIQAFFRFGKVLI